MVLKLARMIDATDEELGPRMRNVAISYEGSLDLIHAESREPTDAATLEQLEAVARRELAALGSPIVTTAEEYELDPESAPILVTVKDAVAATVWPARMYALVEQLLAVDAGETTEIVERCAYELHDLARSLDRVASDLHRGPPAP